MFFLSALIFVVSIIYNFGRYENMGTFKYDTGNMTQLLYNTLHGRLLQFTDYNGENVFRFSEHVDPTILLVLPFYYIWQSPKTLMFVQSLMLILAVVPVYQISFLKLKNKWLSTLLVLIFLVSPITGNLIVTDFHAVSFTVLFIFLSYYFILKNKPFYYFVVFILAILSKENVALSFIPFSFVIYFVYKNKKLGILTFLISLIYTYFAIAVVIPAFRVSENSVHTSFNLAYGYLGSDYIELIKNLVTNPVNSLMVLFEQKRLIYFKDILLLFGILPVFAFPYSLLILPELLLMGFSNVDVMRSLNYQYTAIITPFLFIATINCILKFSKYLKLQTLILLAILLFDLYYSLFINNVTLQYIKNSLSFNHHLKEKISEINLFQPRFTTTPYTIVRLIPNNESVSAPNFMGAHLSEREYIAMYPAKYNEFDSVVVEYYNSSLPPIVFSLYNRNIFADNRQNIAFLLNSSKYSLVLAENGLAYFEKINNGQKQEKVNIDNDLETNYKFSDNLKISIPSISVIDNKVYLVSKLIYTKQSDDILIYTLKTKKREFQVVDLFQYAKSTNKLEFVSEIPMFLTKDELNSEISVTVSEHEFDSGLSIKKSEKFVIFDNISKLQTLRQSSPSGYK